MLTPTAFSLEQESKRIMLVKRHEELSREFAMLMKMMFVYLLGMDLRQLSIYWCRNYVCKRYASRWLKEMAQSCKTRKRLRRW